MDVIFLTVQLIMIIINVIVTLYVWRNRNVQGGTAFASFMTMLTIGSFMVMLQQFRLAYEGTHLVFYAIIPVPWLIFNLQYASLQRWITRGRIVGLCVIPAISTILILTNHLHGLFFTQIHYSFIGFMRIQTGATYGPWFWVHAAYSYLLILVGIVLLVRTALRSIHLYRAQSIALLVAAFIPLISNILYTFKLMKFPATFTGFTITCVIVAISMYRFRFLDLNPIARDLLIDNMSGAMLVLDQTNRIVDINPAMAAFLDRPMKEVIGSPGEIVLERYPALLAYSRDAHKVQSEIALPLGTKLGHYDLRITPLINDRQQLIGRMLVLNDISARKEAEQALRRSEEFSMRLIAAIPDIVIHTNTQGEILFINDKGLELGGSAKEDIVGKNMLSFIAPEDLEAVIQNTILMMEQPLGPKEYNLIISEAERSLYEVNGSVLKKEDGVPYGMVYIVRDISERKRAEEALKEAKDAADAANRSKSVFLANMSHEIRTPMNAILGFAQLMQREPDLSPQSRERLDIINRSGEHLLSLINDILEMSKIEAGRSTFIPNTFDLHSLLHDLERMFHVRTDSKKLRFLSEKIGDVPRLVITDEGKLRQVLINLLGNAVKFTEEGGIALRFRAAAEKENTIQLQFEVEDTGPGMTEDEVGRLFQAFEQTGTGIKSGGTGLGLALSRGFVQIMGGSISVASTIGKGTRLRFEIPVREGKEEKAPQKDVKRRVLRLRPDQKEIRVLVADDRETNRRLLSQLLEVVGFPTREVVNGAEALRMVHEWKPQVVLMDMTMPVMDGYEATRKIKASPDIKNTVIIAVTASAFEEDKQRVFAAGADGYVSKPFKDAELFENIGRLTGAEYLYEEADGSEKASETADDEILMRKSVAALPTDLVDQLRHAVERADIDQLNDLVGQLITDHPTLAKRMREMATRYEYEALIDLLSSGA